MKDLVINSFTDLQGRVDAQHGAQALIVRIGLIRERKKPEFHRVRRHPP